MVDDNIQKVPFTSPEQNLKVRSDTSPQLLATSIIMNIEEGKKVVLSCIGAGAVNQAVKSTAVANGRLAPQGNILYLLPSFNVITFRDSDKKGEMVERTVVRFIVIFGRIY